MPAGRFDDRDAVVGNVTAEICGGGDAVLEIVGMENFFETDGDGFQIAARESAIRGEAFGQDQEILLHLGQAVIVGAEQSADIGEGVLLGGEGAAVGQREHLLRDLFGRHAAVSGLRRGG